jgi:hypothetical protein
MLQPLQQPETSSTSSFGELYNTDNNDKVICEKCSDCELQLKVALEELSSAHKIIEIPQKELHPSKTSLTSPTMCDKGQPSSTKEPHTKSTTDIRALSALNNNSTNQQFSAIPTWADKAKSSLNLQTVNRNIAPNLNGADAKHLMAQKGNKRASTQNLYKIKGNKIPTIVNGIPDYFKEFPSLTRRKEEISKNNFHQKKLLRTQAVNRSNTVKNKVLIIGDSHARNCVPRLQDNLSSEFLISSYVKPGANMTEISNAVKEDLQSLKSDDFVVVWGGANDISKNAKEALKLLTEFVIDHKEPSIVLINSPHRYDLIPDLV